MFYFQFAAATTFGWYWFINKARKDNYRDFYANYDAEKEFQRMKVSREKIKYK